MRMQASLSEQGLALHTLPCTAGTHGQASEQGLICLGEQNFASAA